MSKHAFLFFLLLSFLPILQVFAQERLTQCPLRRHIAHLLGVIITNIVFSIEYYVIITKLKNRL